MTCGENQEVQAVCLEGGDLHAETPDCCRMLAWTEGEVWIPSTLAIPPGFLASIEDDEDRDSFRDWLCGYAKQNFDGWMTFDSHFYLRPHEWESLFRDEVEEEEVLDYTLRRLKSIEDYGKKNLPRAH